MISIIVAIYNQYELNELFLETLRKYTNNVYELIIIDNGSTDGSQELFKKHGATIIQNQANYSYPYCQNQGIKVAKYDILAFFNNDIIVSPGWDTQLLQSMKIHKLDVCGFGCNDTIEKGNEDIRPVRRKWQRVKNLIYTAFGTRSFSLHWMMKLMYGNWVSWNQKWAQKYKDEIREGLSGSCVISTKKGIELIGLWDERVQSADFDIYLKTKKRNLEVGDIRPAHNIMGIYIHHFGRLTVKGKPPVFVDAANIIELKTKWGEALANELLRDIHVHITDKIQ
jgi:GT2 family glycosyltransferase